MAAGALLPATSNLAARRRHSRQWQWWEAGWKPIHIKISLQSQNIFHPTIASVRSVQCVGDDGFHLL